MTGDTADGDAVEHQKKDRADAEPQAAGETLKINLYVVPDVIAEHHYLVASFAVRPEDTVARLIHALVGAQLIRAGEVVNEFGKILEQYEQAQKRHEQ